MRSWSTAGCSIRRREPSKLIYLETVHGHWLFHVFERLPRRPPLRLRQLEAEAGFEGFDDLLVVRDRHRRLGRDAGPHQRERRLQLEQLREGHATPRLAPFRLGLRVMTHSHGFGDRQQAVPLAHLLRQHIVKVGGEIEGRFGPFADLLRAQPFDQVVPRHEVADPRRAGIADFLVKRVAHLEHAKAPAFDRPGHRDAFALAQLVDQIGLVEPNQS